MKMEADARHKHQVSYMHVIIVSIRAKQLNHQIRQCCANNTGSVAAYSRLYTVCVCLTLQAFGLPNLFHSSIPSSAVRIGHVTMQLK